MSNWRNIYPVPPDNAYWVSKWREATEALGGLKRMRAGDMYADGEGVTWVVVRADRELYLVSFPAFATSMNSFASIRRALRGLGEMT